MATGLDSTKTAGRPSHEALESPDSVADAGVLTPQQRLDRIAMESAKRAQNRIHADEGKIPGSSIFTK